jgi:hypothetical protein
MEPLSANDPRTVGDFQIRARLGAGGMGRVYLGFSPSGRAVAVKVVHPELARDQAFIRRFRQEVAAARAVSGMYTAPVVSAGLDDDPPWLATVFVPGAGLDQIVSSRGPLPEPAVWRLAAGLTEALQAVHACGLVHRDLKPANVLLAPDGPHVIDFGISRALDSTALTATGTVFGTPGFMSPEQAEGAHVGPASDVFSLGSVLAYAATGAPPFGNGTAAAVLYRVVSVQPDLSGIPGSLREVVASCLAKNPAERPSLPGLQATISRAAPPAPSSASSFWPAPVAEAIHASQVGAGHASDGAYAQATHTMTAQRPTPAVPAPAPSPSALGGAYPSQPYQPGYRPAGSGYQPRTAPGYAPSPPPGYGPAPWARIPASVLAAVRLMYTGAALTIAGNILSLAIIGQVKAAFLTRHPMVPTREVATVAGIAAGLVIVNGIISTGLWLWMASANRRGRSWARTTATVFFGLDTLAALVTVARPGIPVVKLLVTLIWLIGLAAVIALWQRQSSGYFSAARYR